MNKKISRRTVLLKGMQVTVGGGVLLGLSACGGSNGGSSIAKVCADPNMMTSAEESVRRTLKYTETSPNPDKRCSSCEFFHAGADASACGTCDMFSGAAVNPGGYCDSWSVDS